MRQRSIYIYIVIVLCIFVLGTVNPATALNEPTHDIINQQAARQSTLDQVLKNQLGFPEGIDEPVRGLEGERRVVEWIGEGGIREDDVFRFFNHFHDPLYQADGTGRGPRGSAGLRTLNPLIVVRCGGISFPSSVHWAQEPNQTLGERGAWQDARRYYLDALTRTTKDDRDNAPGRDRAFAEMFETLGHLTHLIQDATVPAYSQEKASNLDNYSLDEDGIWRLRMF